jgi:hypothetical protein
MGRFTTLVAMDVQQRGGQTLSLALTPDDGRHTAFGPRISPSKCLTGVEVQRGSGF